MTIRERILVLLRQYPDGIDDDDLAQVLQLKQRQQANSRCRQLEKEGLVIRRHVRGKIHNFLAEGKQVPLNQLSSEQIASVAKPNDSENWFWEGNVQATVVRYLLKHHSIIHSAADTASRQRGKDIVAEQNRVPLWITVKGYPKGTTKTRPTTQAGHWFKQAVFDIIEYRGESTTAKLGIALPDFPRYRSLAQKIAWFQPVARFSYFWVQENGMIVVE